MDNLKMAFSIIAKEVKKKRGTGEVPVYLGPQGMLALMHDRIAKFSGAYDQTEYVLDLAVMAVFAFATVLPDTEFDDEEESTDRGLEEDEGGEPMGERDGRKSTVPTDNEGISDPRWSPVKPGDPLPRVSPQVEESTDEDS